MPYVSVKVLRGVVNDVEPGRWGSGGKMVDRATGRRITGRE